MEDGGWQDGELPRTHAEPPLLFDSLFGFLFFPIEEESNRYLSSAVEVQSVERSLSYSSRRDCQYWPCLRRRKQVSAENQ